ncbi:MAG: restriction endonuclease subunit S, partial [Eubacteriales bacterium]|nr:restriction endonuclease subunit S [Eubacteriales bacterium]
NHAHIVRGNAGFSNALLYAMLHTMNMSSIVTGAAQPKINQANLKNFKSSIPDIEDARQLSDILDPLFEQIIANDRENSCLADMRDTLLPKLMSREIDVSNIYL